MAVEVTEAQSTTNMDSDVTISYSDSDSKEEDSDQGFYWTQLCINNSFYLPYIEWGTEMKEP